MGEMLKQQEILKHLIKKHGVLRGLARDLGVDSSDLIRWRNGQNRIHPKAAIKLARMFSVKLHDLRPDIFDENDTVVSKEEKTK